MNQKNTNRSTRPLPTDYNKINDMEHSPKREKRRRKFNCTKSLCLVCAVLLSLLIVCVYYLFQKDYGIINEYETKHCMKKDCLLSASSMIKSMDNSFYPCDDFFLYSCGHSNHIKKQLNYNIINQIQYKHEIDLKNSIEALSDDKQPKYIRKVYKYYKSCLNEAIIEKEDINPLNKLIKELGGWPVVEREKWPISSPNYHWLNTYIMMRKIGINANSLFRLNIERDVRNSSRFIANIDPPQFGLNPNSFTDSEQYFSLMINIAEMMGADRVDAQNELLSVLVFEKELIQLSLSEEDHQNNTYFNSNYITVRQMQTFAPNIDWIQFFTEFIGKAVDPNMEIIVLVPTYIRKLNQKLIQTEHRVLANYLIWRVIFQYIPLLSQRWRKPLNKYLRNNFENYREEERWQTCLKQIKILMPYSLGNIYMKKHFNKRKDIEVISMISNIEESFIGLIEKNEWMSDSVKIKAKEKLFSIESRIGFPKELLNEDLLDVWIREIDIEKDYFKNTMRLNLFHINEEMKNVFNSSDIKLSWLNLVNPADIILRYSASDNALLISAALINGFYNEDLPKYLNYGSLGLLISQQMVKVYDESGRLYDESGTHGKWWDKQTEKSLENYIRCFEKQIKDFDEISSGMIDKVRHQFIGQLITDKSVFRQTILAYRSYVQQNGPEITLIGLNHTAEQLFWINSANTFFNFNSYEKIDNSYDIIKYRINSVLSNIKEFSEAFNCSSVSTMNSPIKC